VQHEINDLTATRKDLDLRKIEWYDIEELISDAWGTASRRPKSYYDRIIQAEPATQAKPAASTDIVPYTAHPGHLAAVTEVEVKDKTLKCARFTDEGKLCNADFTWTAREQLLHKRLGYTSIPKSCPLHKPQRNSSYANAPCRKVTSGAPEDCD